MHKIIVLLVIWPFGAVMAITGFFPENGSAGTWLKAGPEELYKNEELFSLINGGADVYFEYGFKQVWVQKYENNSGENIQAEIYQMTSDTAAFGILTYNLVKKGTNPGIGYYAQLTDYSLILCTSNYFVLLRTNEKSQPISEGMCLLAEQITKLLPLAVTGNFMELFPDNVTPGYFKYLKGNLALQSLYPFPDLTVFGQAEVLGYYQNDTLVVTTLTEDRNAGGLVYAKLRAGLVASSKLQVTNETVNSILFIDKRQRKVELVNATTPKILVYN